MASRILIVILVAAIMASLGANFYQFQKSVSLEQKLSGLESKNNDLVQQLTNKSQSVASGYATTNQTSKQLIANSIPTRNQTGNYSSSQSITAVAVKSIVVNDGFFQTTTLQGALMGITVDIRGGEGRILVNTEIPTGVDFQTSARTAAKVAQSLTGADLSSKDIIFSITAMGNAQDLQAADGPSAGGAMTVLLVSDLEQKKLRPDVLMTGTIEQDGTVGPVGGNN